MLQALTLRAEFVAVTSTVTVCRDQKDNFLLSLAADGNATHLITGDKDPLELRNYNETKIVTFAAYLAER